MLIWWLGGKALSFVSALKFRYGRGWILCRRLEWARSAVSSRVALLLRSAEAKLLCYRFVQLCWTSLPFCLLLLRAMSTWFELEYIAVQNGTEEGAWMGMLFEFKGLELNGLGLLTWINWTSVVGLEFLIAVLNNYYKFNGLNIHSWE